MSAPQHAPGHPWQRWLTTLDGNQLRQARRQRGLTQARLAGLAGISLTTIARLEQGHSRASCRTRTLARLAAALGEDPGRLTSTTQDSPPQ